MGDIIEVKGITKSFGTVEALKKIDLSLKEGEVLGIAGESGSGKSTLARLILKLIYPTEGLVFYKGRNIYDMQRDDERKFRKQVQIVFQNPYTSLDPRMSVFRILEEPLRIFGLCDAGDADERITRMLDVVGLAPDFKGKYPHELSGGERQRVGIARALAVEPGVMVLDEPVSSLDVSIQAQILNLLNRIKTEHKLTYIFISHDLSVIKYMCDRVAVLKDGAIAEQGNANELFSAPRSPYVKQLISSLPRLSE